MKRVKVQKYVEAPGGIQQAELFMHHSEQSMFQLKNRTAIRLDLGVVHEMKNEVEL